MSGFVNLQMLPHTAEDAMLADSIGNIHIALRLADWHWRY